MRLIVDNLVTAQGVAIAASSAATDYPISNLQNDRRGFEWRSTGVTSENIVFDMITTEPVNSVVLLWDKVGGIKISSAATITIEANPVNVWTSPALSQAMTINEDWSVSSYYPTSDQNYRYWRIVIEDPGNAYGYVHLSNIIIGKGIDIQNADKGFTLQNSDMSKVVTNDNGERIVVKNALKFKQLKMNFRILDKDDSELIAIAFERNGMTVPVYVTMDEKDLAQDKDQNAVYGYFAPKLKISHVNYDIFRTGLVVGEI